MAKVEVIRAGKPEVVAEREEKCRVAAYCRVSTDSEEQECSYEAQCAHYMALIAANAKWRLAGIYADEGISGTQVRGRKEFERMVEDCEAGKIQLVITKSISRFARNTVDCIRYIRKLKDLGIPIIFEKENINTMDAKGELVITIMASIAQEESQSISQNVRMGIQYRMQQGKGRLNTSIFLGLTRGSDGRLVPVEGEADVVRFIFRAYVDGESADAIARRLEQANVPTPAKGTRWFSSTVRRILENEKYCGDLLLQKYYVTDFLTHRCVRNLGKFPMYFVANAHDPLVPKRLFEEVQGEILRRGYLRQMHAYSRAGFDETLHGRLICGLCGQTVHRCHLPEGRVEWQCRKRTVRRKAGGRTPAQKCGQLPFDGEEAKRAILEVFSHLPSYLEDWIRPRRKTVEEEVRQLDAENTLYNRKKLVPEGENCPEKGGDLEAKGVEGSTGREGEASFNKAGEAKGTEAFRAGEIEETEALTGGGIGKAGEGQEPVAGEVEIVNLPGMALWTNVKGDGRLSETSSRSYSVALWMGMKDVAARERILRRAECMRRLWNLRMLEELAEEIQRNGEGTEGCNESCAGGLENEGRIDGTIEDGRCFEGTGCDWPLSCADYEEFFERTRVHLPGEMFGEDGRLAVFDDALINRYLDHVVVYPERFTVLFKVGLAVEVGRN